MVVGITGGIGSGKSTVLKRLSSLGDIAVYNADVEAKKLMNSSKEIKEKLIQLFGVKTYDQNGLNRSYVSGIVFSDTSKLQQLNAVVHPVVYQHLTSFIKAQASKDYILYENAILFENNSDSFCDVVITVLADTEKRIQRVIARDGGTREAVCKRINAQWKDVKKVMLSNYIVLNDDLKTIDSQIVKIHNNLTKNKPSI